MAQQGEIKTVLSSKLSGGPHGLGKPTMKFITIERISFESIPNFGGCFFETKWLYRQVTVSGDPDDKTLRTSEIKVLIPQIIRERARKIKCVPEVQQFEECCKKEGLLMTFRCKPQTNDLKKCMGHWFHDTQFNEECTQFYLDQRSEYRRTGIQKKKRQFAGHSATTEANSL